MTPERLTQIIADHFGTKALFSQRIKVSRFTAYRWVKDPERMKLKNLERLSRITKKKISELL